MFSHRPVLTFPIDWPCPWVCWPEDKAFLFGI